MLGQGFGLCALSFESLGLMTVLVFFGGHGSALARCSISSGASGGSILLSTRDVASGGSPTLGFFEAAVGGSRAASAAERFDIVMWHVKQECNYRRIVLLC